MHAYPYDGSEVITSAWASGFTTDAYLTVSEWADEHRILSARATAEVGKWRTSRTPYLREIMNCLSSTSPLEKIVLMKGAQIGGTECGNNWIGYVIDQTPGPMLVVQPNVEMAKRWSKGRLAPLIEATPALRTKVKDPRSRDSGNTVQSKEFEGGMIIITGANSAVGLRSMPVRYLFLDEIDGYPHDADNEGDPISLALQRTRTFSRRKIFMVSTPTIQGLSRIEREFLNSDQRHYFVPCPFCNAFQVLKWAQVTWSKGDPTTAHYRCIECNEKIYNYHKVDMLDKGEWRPLNPSASSKVAGFHLSSLYSPVGWFSWQQAVQNFIEAQDHEQLLKVWINTTLGETWVEKGEAPDWQRLYERAEDYPQGIIPEKGLVVTAGVDVQKDRLEVEIVAWSEDKQSWSVDYHVLEGDPYRQDVWDLLSSLLDKPISHALGATLPISMLSIDSGYATQDVYGWIRRNTFRNIMAVKGVGTAIAPLGTPSFVDVTFKGQRLRRGVKVWPVGVNMLKAELYSHLKLTRENEIYPPHYCHFPRYSPEYFKQLTAEQLVTTTVKGYPKRDWQKIRERNEALDCRIYARAAAIAIGVDRWTPKQWQKLKEQIHGSKDENTDAIASSPSQARSKLAIPPRRRRRVIYSPWMAR